MIDFQRLDAGSAWASPYVGLTYAEDGHGPAGWGCWGLVRLVYADVAGLDLPAYGTMTSDEMRAAALAQGRRAEPWAESRLPGAEQALDVVVMRRRYDSRPLHVGVCVAPGFVLHVEEPTGSVIVRFGHASVRGRILSVHRHCRISAWRKSGGSGQSAVGGGAPAAGGVA